METTTNQTTTVVDDLIQSNETNGCRERTWFNSDQVVGELELCPGATNSTEDDFNTFYFYQVNKTNTFFLLIVS